MVNNRIEWIDIAKGIGMILVFWGHTFQTILTYSVNSFHMPLFFFLCGLVYNHEKYSIFKVFFFAKIKQIMKPWFIFVVISLFITLLIPSWRESLFNISFKQVCMELYTTDLDSINNSSLWFLTNLFIVFNLYFILYKYILSKYNIHWFVFVVVGLSLLFLKDFLYFISPHYICLIQNRLPFKIDTALVATLFFIAGSYLKKSIYIDGLIERFNNVKVFILLIIFIVLSNMNGWANLNTYDFGRIKLAYYPIAFMGIFLVIILSRMLERCQKGLFYKIKCFLLLYGKESLVIFGFQGILIRLYLLVFNNVQNLEMVYCGGNPIEHQIGAFLFITLIGTPLTLFFIKFLRNNNISLL